MTATAEKPLVPLAYQRAQAALALGVSEDFFDKHIRPYVKAVYVGSLRLWSVNELQRWLDTNALRAG